MSLAVVEIICTTPLAAFVVWLDATAQPIEPWRGLADAHFNFSRVDQVAAVQWKPVHLLHVSLELTRWSPVICAIVFFGFFGFAVEARRHYRDAFWVVVKPFGLSRPSPHTTLHSSAAYVPLLPPLSIPHTNKSSPTVHVPHLNSAPYKCPLPPTSPYTTSSAPTATPLHPPSPTPSRPLLLAPPSTSHTDTLTSNIAKTKSKNPTPRAVHSLLASSRALVLEIRHSLIPSLLPLSPPPPLLTPTKLGSLPAPPRLSFCTRTQGVYRRRVSIARALVAHLSIVDLWSCD